MTACEFCTNTECDCVERIVCPKVGQIGHKACGWCTVHGGPRADCLDACAHWPTANVYPRVEKIGDTTFVDGYLAGVNRESLLVPGGTPREAWTHLITRTSLVYRAADEATAKLLLPAPIPVKGMNCPHCAFEHVDEGEFATKPHRTHQCQRCFREWRPFEVYTVGVAS